MRQLMLSKFSLFTFLFSFVSLLGTAQIAIETQILTIEEYVNDVLLGNGVEASNITFTGSTVQIGEFTNGGPVNLDAGVILATNHVESVEIGGTGTIPFGENVNGEPDLLSVSASVPDLISAFPEFEPDPDSPSPWPPNQATSINDIAVLEFDFVPSGTEINFNYVMGSTEWINFINDTYNDCFAFFLSGPGISGPYDAPAEFPDGAINIAIVPGTDPQIPVTISSINEGEPFGSNCVHCEYYNHNIPQEHIAMNAYTSVLTAYSEVECGQTYHIKMAIGDANDGALDSCVLLEAGSFQASEPSIVIEVEAEGADIGENTIIEGCLGGNFNITRTSCSETDTINLTVGGTATNGVDYLEIPEILIFEPDQIVYVINIIAFADNLTEGSETIILSFEYEDAMGENQIVEGTIYILDLSQPQVSVDDIYLCPGETITATAVGSQGIGPYTYTWSTGDVANEVDFSQGSAGTYTVTAEDWCLGTGQTSFEVEEPAPFVSIADTVIVCYARETPSLVSGGKYPYVYEYDPTGLKLDEDHASFTGLKEGEFEVVVTDDCGQEREILVIVDFCDTTIPNIFSPPSNGTGDGYNDRFVIEGIEGFPRSALYVYNRWGVIVFEAESYNNEWDAEGLSEGVYYYVFKRSDGKSYSGYVQVVRD